MDWGMFWDFHNIVFASIFTMIALYTICCAYVAWRRQITKRVPQNLQNLLIFLLCTSRAFVLFADPYLQGALFTDHTFTKLLWYLSEPALVSIHCLLIVIVAGDYTVNKLRILKNLSFALMVTHYVLVTVIVLVAESYPTVKQSFLIFRRLIFLVWGYFIAVNVVRLASTLWRKFKEEGINGGRFLVNWIYTCGMFNLALLGIYAYTTIVEVILYVNLDTEHTGPWKWLATQTAMRLSEIISCELVLTVLAKHRTSSVGREQEIYGYEGSHNMAARREKKLYGYEESNSISIDQDFYSVMSYQSFQSVVFTGSANEQPTGNGLANKEQPFSHTLSNQSRGYGGEDSHSAQGDDNGRTDREENTDTDSWEQ